MKSINTYALSEHRSIQKPKQIRQVAFDMMSMKYLSSNQQSVNFINSNQISPTHGIHRIHFDQVMDSHKSKLIIKKIKKIK